MSEEAVKNESYSVVVDTVGCSSCGAGRTWMVLSPDGIGGGTSYAVEDDAVDDLGKARVSQFHLHGTNEGCSGEKYCWGDGEKGKS